jgi:hypothetical protein
VIAEAGYYVTVKSYHVLVAAISWAIWYILTPATGRAITTTNPGQHRDVMHAAEAHLRPEGPDRFTMSGGQT